MEIELPEACKICLANADNHDVDTVRPFWSDSGKFNPCYKFVGEGGNACLPKDRAMIVLLDKLLKK